MNIKIIVMSCFLNLFKCFRKRSSNRSLTNKLFVSTKINSNLKDLDYDDVEFFNLKNYETWAKVGSVYDGDTLSIMFYLFGHPTKFKCRLAHIDAAEKRSQDPEEAEYAQRGLNRLLELIGSDKIVFVKCHNFDKYGRLLVEIYSNESDTKSINQTLLDENLAYRYEGGSKKPFREWVMVDL